MRCGAVTEALFSPPTNWNSTRGLPAAAIQGARLAGSRANKPISLRIGAEHRAVEVRAPVRQSARESALIVTPATNEKARPEPSPNGGGGPRSEPYRSPPSWKSGCRLLFCHRYGL
jgi:hypothetical protein